MGSRPISEPGDDAGALVDERQRLVVVDPFQLGFGVARRLLFNRGDVLAPVLGLGLDDADGAFVNEENVVGGANVRPVLADRDARTGIEVDRLFVLNLPAGRLQHPVDVVAGDLLGSLVPLCHVQSINDLTSPAPLCREHKVARNRAKAMTVPVIRIETILYHNDCSFNPVN